MSLDSNCQRNRVGLRLPHSMPCATPESSGINVFAHSLSLDHNIYVFPPSVLIAPLLKYVLEQDFHGAFTIVVRLEASTFLVGAAAVTRCRSCSIEKEERGFHFVVPFSGRSRMVSKELALGLMGFPPCWLNLPVCIFLGGGSMEARPSLFCLPLPQ